MYHFANINSTSWKNISCRAKTNFGRVRLSPHAGFLDRRLHNIGLYTKLAFNTKQIRSALSTFWQTVRRLNIEIIISKKVSFLIM